MTKKKVKGPIESLQSASTIIAAQPATAMNAITDFALWGSCIYAAHGFLETNAGQFMKDHPVQSWALSGIFGPFGPFVGGILDQAKYPNQIPTNDNSWKWAFIVGTLAFGTLKYAGQSIAEGIFGAVSGAAKAVGAIV